MKELTYKSQIDAIGYKALERKLDLEEVGDYYHTWHAAARQAYPDPKVPSIYHDFLSERETWTHYYKHNPKDEGKDPLLDCLMSAPYYTEKDMERHIKVGGDAVDFKIAQLREIIQQKDLLIKSKDELLEVKEEALRASKELLAQKDKIIKIREGEIQDANTTINSREQTIAEKDEIIRNREENLQQAQITITAHERTIEQKTEAVKNAKQPRKEVYVQLTKKDKAIERQKAHIERQEGALRVKGIKNKELEQRRVDEVATLKTKLAEKDDKIQALEKMLEKGRFASLSPIPKTEPREADPSRSYILKIEAASNTRDDGSEDEEILSRSTNVKAEPMDY